MSIAKANLTFNSEKKHSVRYDAEDASEAVSSLYIKKTHLDKPWPQNILIVIEEN